MLGVKLSSRKASDVGLKFVKLLGWWLSLVHILRDPFCIAGADEQKRNDLHSRALVFRIQGSRYLLP